MKKLIIMFVVALLAPQIIQAQGITTYLSNLGQPSTGNLAVGSDSWYAALFFTGGNASGYVLNSVQLAMTDDSGNPSGFTVMLYSSTLGTGAFPGSSLGTLDGSANPSTSSIYTYTSSGLTLAPSTPYFIVLTAGTTVANGSYEWSLAGIDSYNPSGHWGVIQGVSSGVFDSNDGSFWHSISRAYPQFAINATPIPEPSPSWLLLLGSGVLIYVRRVKKLA